MIHGSTAVTLADAMSLLKGFHYSIKSKPSSKKGSVSYAIQAGLRKFMPG